jgi:hypothetical protein
MKAFKGELILINRRADDRKSCPNKTGRLKDNYMIGPSVVSINGNSSMRSVRPYAGGPKESSMTRRASPKKEVGKPET